MFYWDYFFASSIQEESCNTSLQIKAADRGPFP